RGAAAGEGHPDNLVPGEILAVPAAVLADEGAFGEGSAESAVPREGQAQRGDVRAEGVVRANRAGDQSGLLRADPRIDVLAPVAVGPAVEGTLAHRGQIVGDQLRANLVTLVDHRPEGAGGRLDGQGGRVADAGCDGAPGAGQAIDGPDHRPLLDRKSVV